MTAPTASRAIRANYTPGIPIIDDYFQANPISDLTELDASHFCELYLLLSPVIFSSEDQETADENEVSRRMKNFLAYLQRHWVALKPKEGKKMGVKKLVGEAVELWREIVEETDGEEGVVVGAGNGITKVEDASHVMPVVQRESVVQNITQAKVKPVLQKKATVQKKVIVHGNAQVKPIAQKQVTVQGNAYASINTQSYSSDGSILSNPNIIGSSDAKEDLLMSYTSDCGEGTTVPPPPASINNNTNDLNIMASSSYSSPLPSSSASAATVILNNLLVEIMQGFQAGEYLRSVVLLGKASGFVVQVGEEAVEAEKQYYGHQQAGKECFGHDQDQGHASDAQILASGDDSGGEFQDENANSEKGNQIKVKEEKCQEGEEL